MKEVPYISIELTKEQMSKLKPLWDTRKKGKYYTVSAVEEDIIDDDKGEMSFCLMKPDRLLNAIHNRICKHKTIPIEVPNNFDFTEPIKLKNK